jgi:chromosome segregation ATPase
MGKIAWLIAVTAAALLVSPTSLWSQQNDQQAPGQGQTESAAQAGPAGQDSLAEAARKAREEKKEAPKSSKTFTNDNLPTAGGISTVGDKTGTSSSDTPATAAAGQTGNDEKAWRSKFAALRHKLEQDQANLEVMKRELGQLNLQYYNDPVKAMQQELTRSDINNKVADIDKMKSQIEADQQAISDAEEELRKSGGDPGWAR